MTALADELRAIGGIGAAVVLLALGRDTAPAYIPIIIRVPVAVPSPPVTVTRTVVAAPRPAARASCPAPVSEAPAANPARFPAEVRGVTAAPTDARWIATWDEQHVFVSTDGGATFARVLDGPGRVADASFDCFGHAIVLRDGGLVGVHDGHDRWTRVPGLRGVDGDPDRVIGGGPDVIVLGITSDDWQARLAISPDLGASWAFRDLASSYESDNASGREEADGTIHLAMAVADCMSDPMRWYVIDRDGVRAEDDRETAPGALYVHGDIAYAAGRWRKRDQPWRDITGLPKDTPQIMLGAVPRAIAGDAVYRLHDGVATPLRPWPPGITPAAVDLAGRIWGLAPNHTEGTQLVVVAGRADPAPRVDPCCDAE